MGEATVSTLIDGGAQLLFPPGSRPDCIALREALARASRIAITHDMCDGQEDGALLAIELLRDGLTYDLVGIAPGPPAPLEPARHRFGVDTRLPVTEMEALALQPGPHLIAGARTMPVVRTLMGIVRSLIDVLPDLVLVGWPPAGTLTGRDFFAATTDTWLGGGAFPALGLTAFVPTGEGGLRSEGLAFFTGQELELAPGIGEGRMEATRLAVRLVHHLVAHGRLEGRDELAGPDGGTLVLEPADGGRLVRVRSG